jgi:hypothetical protein
MNARLLYVFLVAIVAVKSSFAMSFDTEAKHIQNYVVSQLIKAVKANDRIVIVYGKWPSGWFDNPEDKTTGISFWDANLLGLSLDSASPVEFLKGSITARVNDCALFYREFSSQEDTSYRSYIPTLGRDRMCRLVFVQP